MSSGLTEFLRRWLIGTVAVLMASYIVPGIHYEHWQALLVATFLLGLLNTFVRPLLVLFSLPLVLVTLGLFTLVINALLLLLVGWLMQPRFQVEGFWQALLAALVISLVTLALNQLTGSGDTRVEVRRGQRRRGKPRPHDGDGPVIDV